MDKEFIVLESIEKNSSITQRELSEKAGISLGSVNLLLNKMVKEGLIKIERIPADRVLYMLTPKGLLEKMNKTYNYIKYHYAYINDTKEKIKKLLINESKAYENKIIVVAENDELSKLVDMAVKESGCRNIEVVCGIEGIAIDSGVRVIALNRQRYEECSMISGNVINLLELL